ncbi:NAD-binding Rossmann fold oxidoreductase family protein [Purpureocillium lavendulum]|uniref:NAD-binding Rossmann fold oxidoreductase family protein n=1 Tax=Purpureocillium lavendulum TaxID=1247861 RepID=A0AB34FW78_9HYPO|nr:NAD-binding Rossmann fold oxidoreductase family protein [Purpureocillium lavendulum]
MAKRLSIAAAGLGRMGKRHALNFLNRTPRAELVAAFSPDPEELAWAKVNLEPYGVTLYDDYQKMLEHTGLNAVVIGTATSVHAEEAIQAMRKDLHVLCEKPLSTNIDVVGAQPRGVRPRHVADRCSIQCRDVVAEARKRPHLKVMCGFSRRFDASYRDAFDKMERGLIGRPSIIRSQTCDKHDPSGFFVEYAAWSGGVFVDMSIHDIDLTLWFFGDHVMPKSVSAYGIRAVQPDLAQHNDVDNAVGIVEFWGGKIGYYFCSRMMAHGQEDTTEVIGTEGKLSINGNPQSNLVNHFHAGGITREVPHDYYGRFEMAFVRESNEFAEACLDNKPLPMKLSNAVKAVEIGAALQEALVTGRQIRFDETGRRTEGSKL